MYLIIRSMLIILVIKFCRIHDVITCTESPFQDGNDGGMVEVIKRMDRK